MPSSVARSNARHTGFLLTRQWVELAEVEGVNAPKSVGRLELRFWLKTPQGPVELRFPHQQAVFFIGQGDAPKAASCLERLTKPRPLATQYQIKSLDLRNFYNEPVCAVYCATQVALYRARDSLRQQRVECFESDVVPTDRFLMERFITGPVQFAPSPGETSTDIDYRLGSDRASQAEIFYPQKFQPTSFNPSLAICSLDIETSMDGKTLYSIGVCLAHSLPPASVGSADRVESDCLERRVWMLRNQASSRESADNLPDNPPENHPDYLELCATEHEVLTEFLNWLKGSDPDLIIGWRVINFDLRFLQKKADQLRVPLTLGRNDAEAVWRASRQGADSQSSGNDGGHYHIFVPGRCVVDGIEALKSATWTFESFSLQNVASALLQRGKLIHDVDNRGAEITELFHRDQPALAAYNLEDCVLVWDIFRHTRLIAFLLERASLTGLALDRFGGSVAAFDHRYLPRLHRRGFIAPDLADEPVGVGSPGGYVMNSQPGLYENVLVLDFKSLYPSIIRTFHVDPLARITAYHQLGKNDEEPGFHADGERSESSFSESHSPAPQQFTPGFRGALFDRENAILPDLIEELWEARDRAKTSENQAMSQAIKILMNSFYGVMGTPGCRFFDHRLPSSITLRGHQILQETKRWIEAHGHRVIYGDTDSVFVYIQGVSSSDTEQQRHQLMETGEQLAKGLNQFWQTSLQDRYQLTSFLDIEFETCFAKFVMPTIRGTDIGSKKRYAGLRWLPDGSQQLVFKGLETVRSDWTPLARRFQKELYRRVFAEEDYIEFIRDVTASIKNGEEDGELYYRKRLRRNIDEYRNIPPQVQAARKADEARERAGKKARYKRGGWIEYWMTLNGPEDREHLTSPLDYELYIERQIAPIADGILHFLGTSFAEAVGDQLRLF